MIDAYGDKRNRALEPDGRVRRLAEIALAGFAERSWHRCLFRCGFLLRIFPLRSANSDPPHPHVHGWRGLGICSIILSGQAEA